MYRENSWGDGKQRSEELFQLKDGLLFFDGGGGLENFSHANIFYMPLVLQTIFVPSFSCKHLFLLAYNSFQCLQLLQTIHFKIFQPPPPPSKKEWSVPYIFWQARRKRKSSAADNRFERISRGVRSDDNFFQADSPSLWNGWRFFPTDRPSRSNDNNFYCTSHSNGRTFLFGTDSQSCSKKYQIFETKAFHYYR